MSDQDHIQKVFVSSRAALFVQQPAEFQISCPRQTDSFDPVKLQCSSSCSPSFFKLHSSSHILRRSFKMQRNIWGNISTEHPRLPNKGSQDVHWPIVRTLSSESTVFFFPYFHTVSHWLRDKLFFSIPFSLLGHPAASSVHSSDDFEHDVLVWYHGSLEVYLHVYKSLMIPFWTHLERIQDRRFRLNVQRLTNGRPAKS